MTLPKLCFTSGLTLLLLTIPACGKVSPLLPKGGGKESKGSQLSKASEADLRAVEQAIESGNFEQAEVQLKTVLMSDEPSNEVLFLTARLKAAQGNLSDAVALLELIPDEANDAKVAALGQSGDWYIELGQLRDAEKCFRRLLSLVPNLPMAYRRLAYILNNEGRRFEALEPMRKLAQISTPSESELYGMNCFAEPFLHTFDGPASAPHMEPSALCQAKLLAYQGKLREAIDLMQELHSSKDSTVSAMAFHGRLQAEMLDLQWVEDWRVDLPVQIEEQPDYWYTTGLLYQSKGQHEIAIRCFLETVSRDDTFRFAYLALARSLALLSKSDESQRAMVRYDLLEEANLIYVEISRTEDQLKRLVDILLMLKRPYEARAWLKAIQKTSQPPRSERDYGNAKFEDERKKSIAEAIAAVGASSSFSFKTCDLELNEWPLPQGRLPSKLADKETTLPYSPHGNIEFVDVAKAVGLDFLYLPSMDPKFDQLHFHETIGGGIAVLDYNRDGWFDYYFAQSAGLQNRSDQAMANAFYLNLFGKQFRDVTSFTETDDFGYGQGVSALDFNQDGFCDLVVANIGLNCLLINNGDGTFSKAELGTELPNASQWTTTIVGGDLTGDGLPELIEVNYIDDAKAFDGMCNGLAKPPACNPQKYKPAKNRFLYNNGDGSFVIWERCNDLPQNGYGLCAMITNFDKLAGNDVFIANDTSGNQFWVSHELGSDPRSYSLTDEAMLKGCGVGPIGIPQSCMGVAHGDFDHNGMIDMHITNYTDESSDLYMQQASGLFLNQFASYDLDIVTKPFIGWGTQAADFDSDGWLDLMILNGHLYYYPEDVAPYRMSPQLLRGAPGSFVSQVNWTPSGDFSVKRTLGRSLVITDWNQDGKVDLIANHLDCPVALLQNQTESGKWIKIELVGTDSERDAIGAEVIASCDGYTWHAWRVAGSGYLGSNEPVIHMGLGEFKGELDLKVVWPSGQVTEVEHVVPNQSLLIIENESA